MNTGKEEKSFPLTHFTTFFATHDNKYLMCESENDKLKLISINDGSEIKISITILFSHISGVCISPDKRWLAARHSNERITLWNTINTKETRILQDGGNSSCNLIFSSDSKTLAYSAKGGKIALYNLATNQVLKYLDPQLSTVRIDFSPDGKYLISTHPKEVFYVWDVETGMVKINLKGSKYTEPTWTASFSNDGNYIVSGSADYCVKLWDARNGQELYTYGTHMSERMTDKINSHNGAVSSSCFAMNGQYLITATDLMKEIIIWNTKGGIVCTLNFPKDKTNWGMYYPSMALTVSKDNQYLFATYGNKIAQWDIQTIYQKHGTKAVLQGQLPPNENPFRVIVGHSNNIYALSVTHDSKFLISSSSDASIKGWDITTGKNLFTLVPVGETDWVITNPEGLFDGTENGYKPLYFTTGTEQIALSHLFDQYYTPNLLTQVLHGSIAEKPKYEFKDLKPAPLVKIINLVNNSVLSLENCSVQINVTDQGGGIDEIRLYHNDKLVDGTQRGFKTQFTSGNIETKTFILTLVNGENRIKATAFNSQRTESIPDEIIVNYKAPAITKPSMYVLAVGINTYKNPKYNLNYAKNDADGFVKALQAVAVSIFEKVMVTVVNDEQATKNGILDAVEKIKSEAKPEDVFVFYYAGHGVMSTGSVSNPAEFFLVPHDVVKMYDNDDVLNVNALSTKIITEFSKTLKPQKQLFVLDACQSGAAIQTFATRGAAEEKAIAQLSRSTGTYFIAASGSDQFATEVATLGHGIFTYSIIKSLQGSCKVQDGKVTVNLLKGCVEDMVPDLSTKYKGQPQYPTGYGYGQDFPIGIVK